MEMRTLGRTGLSVSVMGLGCGGHSRLGLTQGLGDRNAIGIVAHALDIGVNFIDTAEQYETEKIVGKALAESGFARDSVVISTKVSLRAPGSERLRTGSEFCAAADERLRLLRTPFIDILHLHGVMPTDYAYCRAELIPALESLRAAGKVRFAGITEFFQGDLTHRMLIESALRDDVFDVIMVGFNILNQSARLGVLTVTREKSIGTLGMFAVRRSLSQPEALHALMQDLYAQGKLRDDEFPHSANGPLGFIVDSGAAESIPDAAYRFCRDEPGMGVVLCGTGSIEHLDANAASLSRPPLPAEITAQLLRLFAGIDSVSGN